VLTISEALNVIPEDMFVLLEYKDEIRGGGSAGFILRNESKDALLYPVKKIEPAGAEAIIIEYT
jgi:hypothetical protein